VILTGLLFINAKSYLCACNSVTRVAFIEALFGMKIRSNFWI